MSSKITMRVRALDFAVASASEDEGPTDVIRRAQIYADWLDGVFTVPVQYQMNEAAAPEGDNVIPMTTKDKLQ
jgi:hypothetical protein